ncbi:putative spermine/spermidine synthase [Phytophthora cinnamomi]|uniref:putative spermine/spermidine synthase n=1 Tax=Phytophthora cinnamomi TaxID=4785 RepID=UPI0035598EC9|nr:putative spermine/spermidine synthase [Phytophthora cinnamomi]
MRSKRLTHAQQCHSCIIASVMHSEAWLALHLPQLQHYNVPHHLHQQVYDCVHEVEGGWSDFGAVASTQAASEASRAGASHRKLRAVATMPLPAASQVLQVGHVWEFQSVVDAQTQLRQDAALRGKMKKMVEEVIEEDKHELTDSGEESDVEKEVEGVVRHLHLLAFSIRFGANSDDMSYYVLNILGSSLRENDEESNLKVMPIFCMEQQKLFSVAWTTKDVASGGELVRPYAGKISLMGLCKKSYWEARFEAEGEFDWYCEYSHIRELVASYIPKTARVLISGTGTSRLPGEMALDGYSDIVAMDYAANVIEKMQARSEENAWGVRFVEADLTQMKGWESGSVDCVIDKGCLDAMLLKPETEADETNWKLVTPDSPDDLVDAQNSMQQLARILKPDGLLFFLTFGSPSNRVNMFDWVASDNAAMEWEILQCLEMSPTDRQQTFVTRFFLFVARKKLKQLSTSTLYQ